MHVKSLAQVVGVSTTLAATDAISSCARMQVSGSARVVFTRLTDQVGPRHLN